MSRSKNNFFDDGFEKEDKRKINRAERHNIRQILDSYKKERKVNYEKQCSSGNYLSNESLLDRVSSD